MDFPFRDIHWPRPNLNVVTLHGVISGVISGSVCGRCGRTEALTATVEAGLMKGKRTLLRHCLLKLNENSDFSRNLSPSRACLESGHARPTTHCPESGQCVWCISSICRVVLSSLPGGANIVVCKACGLLDEIQSYLKDPTLGKPQAAHFIGLLQDVRDQMHVGAQWRAVKRRVASLENPPRDQAMFLEWIKQERENKKAESLMAPAYQAAAESAWAASSSAAGSRDSRGPPYYP